MKKPLLLPVLLCAFCLLGFSSEAEENAGFPGTAGELLQAIGANSGEAIAVAGDIIWDMDGGIGVSEPVTIELGEYGIHVPAGVTLYIDGPVTFVGEGVNTPLITSEGYLNLSGGAVIRAEGDGCTAVQARNLSTSFSEIYGIGDGATAVEITGQEKQELYSSYFSAQGEGSVAVRGNGALRLTLCKAVASGGAVVTPGEVELDGCNVSPEVQGAAVVEREIIPGNRLVENGLCISEGSRDEELMLLRDNALGDSIELAAYDSSEQTTALSVSLPASYDNFPQSMPPAGSYKVVCAPQAPFWFPADVPQFSFHLNVIKENQPFILDAQDAGSGAFLRFFQEISGQDSVTLWYSEDGGASWHDAVTLPGSLVLSYGAQLEGLKENHTYLFMLEVVGGAMAGKSNVLEFNFYDQYHINGGGNRDNDDREDMGELPGGDYLVPPPAEQAQGPVSPSPGPQATQEPVSREEPEGSKQTAEPGSSWPAGKEPEAASDTELPEESEPESYKAEEFGGAGLWLIILGMAVLLVLFASILALRSKRGRH